ncbi:DapH/DapD/GlmU-related protein [Nocardioides sambongensis]|uniref:DapH/DapD/GlmU-related protein n=1 Tax=Nocardioides sambongensis TaxID=2589074 RepID=UPI001126390F|nr:DapH/DapD/GlmU-related protein [Nocardioides sambongensis]
MRRLLLVAASGLAREVLAVERRLGVYADVHVVDDDEGRWGSDLDGVPIVGDIGLAREYDDHEVLVCAGSGRARRAIVGRLAGFGVGEDRFTTFVDPSVQVPDDSTVAAGSIILAGAVLTSAVTLGRHVVVMPNVTLTHDVVLADFVTLCAGVSLGGGAAVGEGAYLGMNATVRQGARVGVDATLGMGAALLTDLPAGETWVGVPAQPIHNPARQLS